MHICTQASKRPACTPALPANASDPPKPTMVVKHDTSFLSRRTLLQQAGLAAMLYQMSAMSDAAKAVDGEDNYDDAAGRKFADMVVPLCVCLRAQLDFPASKHKHSGYIHVMLCDRLF